jgi:aminoglycoside 6'-N-acetyltransferase
MKLRHASRDDVAILEYWDTQPHVIAAGGAWDDFDWATEVERRVPWRELLIAEIDGRPIGVLQIIDPTDEEDHYWGDIAPGHRAIDIWIGEVDCLGRGHGTAMMRAAIDRCFADPTVHSIVIDPLAANTRAIRFYERLGFVRVGRRFFGEDDCVVLKLQRATRKGAG